MAYSIKLSKIRGKEEKNYQLFIEKKNRSFMSYCKKGILNIKNESIITLLIKKIKELLNDKNKKNKNQIKKNKNDIINNIIKNNEIIIIIIFIIINILYTIKCNTYDLLYFQYSSEIILKVKGIGISNIFGNETNYNFKSMQSLKAVYINGDLQSLKEYKYTLNQTDNLIELIWYDNITT